MVSSFLLFRPGAFRYVLCHGPQTDPARKDRAAAIRRLRLVARALNTGKSNRQIARELHCNERTVRFNRQKLAKLTPAELESVLHGEAPHALLKKANTTPTSSAPGTPNPRTVAAIVDLIFRCLQEEWTVVIEAVVPFRGRQRLINKHRLVPADQERVLKDVDTSWKPLRFGSRPCGKRAPRDLFSEACGDPPEDCWRSPADVPRIL